MLLEVLELVSIRRSGMMVNAKEMDVNMGVDENEWNGDQEWKRW